MTEGRPEPFVDAELAAFIEQGVAVIVATRDDQMNPEITRGWGPLVGGDGRELSLCVNAAAASATRRNLAANGEIAITGTLHQNFSFETITSDTWNGVSLLPWVCRGDARFTARPR